MRRPRASTAPPMRRAHPRARRRAVHAPANASSTSSTFAPGGSGRRWAASASCPNERTQRRRPLSPSGRLRLGMRHRRPREDGQAPLREHLDEALLERWRHERVHLRDLLENIEELLGDRLAADLPGAGTRFGVGRRPEHGARRSREDRVAAWPDTSARLDVGQARSRLGQADRDVDGDRAAGDVLRGLPPPLRDSGTARTS